MPRLLHLLAPTLIAATLCWPTSARADEPEREVTYDPQAFPAPSTRIPLVLVGAGTTAVWYGAALGGSYLYPTARGADELRMPIAGPWMSLAQTGCPKTTPNCSTFWMVVGAVLKGLDGVGQAGGLLIMAEGLLLPTVERPEKTVGLSDKTVDFSGTFRTGQLSFRPVPVVSADSLGLTVTGTF